MEQCLHNTVGLFPVPTGALVVAPGLSTSWCPHSQLEVPNQHISELSTILFLPCPSVSSQ